jgi:hypothetical protein
MNENEFISSQILALIDMSLIADVFLIALIKFVRHSEDKSLENKRELTFDLTKIKIQLY